MIGQELERVRERASAHEKTLAWKEEVIEELRAELERERRRASELEEGIEVLAHALAESKKGENAA
jgi:predicted nuclease with TOPRIM domain